MAIDSIIPFVMANVMVAVTAGYTKPASAARYLTLAAVFPLCLISVRSTVSKNIPGGIGADYIIGFLFHTSNWLLFLKLAPPPSATPVGRMTFGFDVIMSSRIGIKAKNLPSFAKNNEKFTPSRTTFIAGRLWDLCWTLSIMYFLNAYEPNYFPGDILSVPTGFLRRFSSMTPREMNLRIYFTILGLVVPYCALRAAHSFTGCLAVVCGDDPSRWPPLFGDVGDAHTVRRFWAYFWHALMRRAFTSHATLIVNKIFRLPAQSFVSRYVTTIVVFLMGAVLHIAATPGFMSCSIWPQVQFHLSIIGAFILEDVAISVYENLATKIGVKTTTVTSQFWHLVGYSWVALFYVWAVSKMVYTMNRCVIEA